MKGVTMPKMRIGLNLEVEVITAAHLPHLDGKETKTPLEEIGLAKLLDHYHRQIRLKIMIIIVTSET